MKVGSAGAEYDPEASGQRDEGIVLCSRSWIKARLLLAERPGKPVMRAHANRDHNA